MEPPATFFPSSSCLEIATGGQSEEELLTALRKGSFLLKHGRHGRPKAHFFRLSTCDNELRWRSASGAVKSVTLASVRDFLPGQGTEVFRRYPVREPAASFSLRYIDPSGALRTLDLTCRDREQYTLWYPGLQIAVQRSIAAMQAVSLVAGASPGAGGKDTAAGGYEQQQQQVEQIVPGDLFIWGCASNPSFLRSSTPPPPQEHFPTNNKNINNKNTAAPNLARESQTHHSLPIDCWPRRLTPTPVPLNSILDASTASVGRRHAAIVSAQGALYVLGEGAGGKLGRGHDNPAPVPQRTNRGLPGDGKIIATSCGDEYTAAITPDGQLYTWGRLPGESLPIVLPMLVRGGLTNISVCQVSCGPFHTAAVASDGRLFTWGEGFGGKLGHGDQITRLQPTHVVALHSMPVLQVACGVWHTAAIVLEPPGLHPQLHGNQPPISPGAGSVSGVGGGLDIFSAAAPPSPNFTTSRQSENLFLPSTPSRSHHRRTSSSISGAAEYGGYQEGRGGALYTWGGVNEAVSFGEGGGGTQRRDSNKGCLGHGDIDLYTGQTLPTRVGGPGCQLTGKGVRSIAAGLHLTMALTTTGVVYQMGATGASGNTSVLAPWEGATSAEPVRGQLANYFVDAIACGMHHVVVLARPIEKKVGRPVDQSIPTVFTWGRGSEGQLGTGKWDDSPSPVAIEENLKGRRAVAVAAGGATTMVVCDHDFKKFEDVGLQGKEAIEIETKTLLSLLEPRSLSTRPSSAALTNGGNNNNNNTGKGSSRSGWLLTRDERPPSRSSFRGASSFSFTSAASGSTGLGAGSTGGGGSAGNAGNVGIGGVSNNQLNLSRMSSSSMHSLGSSSGNGAGGGGGGKGNEGAYPPYSIISISGTSTAPSGTGLHRNMSVGSSTGTPDFLFYSNHSHRSNSFVAGGAAAGVSGRNSLNYQHQQHGEGGIRSTMSSSSSLSQSQSAIGKFDPFGDASGIQRKSVSSAGRGPTSPKVISITSTPATSPGSIKGAAGTSAAGMTHRGTNGGSTKGGTATTDSSLSASPGGAGSSSSSLHQNIASKGRYIARLEQRLEALQIKNRTRGDEELAVAVEQGDEKLKQAVAESALQYRESIQRALGSTNITSTSSGVTAASALPPPLHQPPHPPPPLILPSLEQQQYTDSGTTPHPSFTPAPTPSSISDPAVVEELLQRKQAELERQQQALAAWAEELRKKEEALLLRGKTIEEQGKEEEDIKVAQSPSTTPLTDKTTATVTAAAAAVTGLVAVSTPQQGSTAGDHAEPENSIGNDDKQPEQQQQQQQENQIEKEEEEWVEELEQGVTATFIRDLTTGTSRLKRLRFSKTHFSAATASAWYTTNASKLIPTSGGSPQASILAQPPPSVGLSESVATTPSKQDEAASSAEAEVSIPINGAAAVAAGGSVAGTVAVARSRMDLFSSHGRVDSRNMSFDAKDLAQLHAEFMHTYPTAIATSTAGIAGAAALTTPVRSPFSSPLPPIDGSMNHEEEKQQQQQEFHTPLTKMVDEENGTEEEEESTTEKVRTRTSGVAPSPPLESLFNQAVVATTASQSLAIAEEVEEGDDDDDSSSEASLVSATSGGAGGRKSMMPRGNGTNSTGLSGVILSPPPPRRPSPTRRPRSGGSGSGGGGGLPNNAAAATRLRSFALSDVHSTVDSQSPTASTRSLDLSSGFMRPGSQSPVDSTRTGKPTTAGGGGGGGGGGSGLLRSVAARIARSIIGGEDYTNISIPSPTTSAASSTEQHSLGQQQQQQDAAKQKASTSRPAPMLVFGARRTKSNESSKSRR